MVKKKQTSGIIMQLLTFLIGEEILVLFKRCLPSRGIYLPSFLEIMKD